MHCLAAALAVVSHFTYNPLQAAGILVSNNDSRSSRDGVELHLVHGEASRRLRRKGKEGEGEGEGQIVGVWWWCMCVLVGGVGGRRGSFVTWDGTL